MEDRFRIPAFRATADREIPEPVEGAVTLSCNVPLEKMHLVIIE